MGIVTVRIRLVSSSLFFNLDLSFEPIKMCMNYESELEIKSTFLEYILMGSRGRSM